MLNGLRWLLQDRIVLTEFSGVLTIDDFIQVREGLQELISPQHLPAFYVIYDASARTQVDWRFSDLMHIRDLGYRHPRQRSIAIVDKNPHPLASIVGRMAVHFHGLTMQITRSQDEAIAYLNKIDPTLRATLPR